MADKMRDRTALTVRDLAIDFFKEMPYSSARISYGRLYRMSFYTGMHFRDTPWDKLPHDVQTDLLNIRKEFLDICRKAGIKEDVVSMEFHSRSGVYASVRVAIPAGA